MRCIEYRKVFSNLIANMRQQFVCWNFLFLFSFSFFPKSAPVNISVLTMDQMTLQGFLAFQLSVLIVCAFYCLYCCFLSCFGSLTTFINFMFNSSRQLISAKQL